MTKKVIHVLGKLDAGGVESWLVNLLKNTDSKKIRHEFLLQKPGKGFYDEEIIFGGGKIHHCLNNGNPFIYSLNLYKILKLIRPDIIHSHVHVFSGLVLFVAFLCGVKIRISHSHSDTRNKESKASVLRKIYIYIMKKLIGCFATHKLAVSEKAAECVYGLNWQMQKNITIMPCGIDISKFNPNLKDHTLRQQIGIPNDAFVIGHVGRFVEAKNHSFLIDVFNEVSQKNDNVYLVLVGNGPLLIEIQKKVEELGLKDKVKFLGLRKDVPILMLNIFDIFLFPSLWEGLPLTLVEAQLSGLYCLASKEITPQVDIGFVKFLKISDPILWAESIFLNHEPKEIKSHIFSIQNNIKILDRIYIY